MSITKVENAAPVPTKPPSKPYGKIVLTLKNCLLPEDKLLPTPSQVDGLDYDIEIDQRILGCEMIQTAGILLKLPQVAMATGQVLFQRFYFSKSFVRHSMETTAMGCVCLASKIEEAPRRIRDVINVFHHIKQIKGQKIKEPWVFCGHIHMEQLREHQSEVLCQLAPQATYKLAWTNASLRHELQ